ncbi:MAG: helix-turn-helix domain-containing protein [bacterium]|jgi:excisionase family DNA binding protein
MQKYINLNDTAKLLNCSKSKLYNYIKQDLIPFKMFGKRYLFSVEEIENLINKTKKQKN